MSNTMTSADRCRHEYGPQVRAAFECAYDDVHNLFAVPRSEALLLERMRQDSILTGAMKAAQRTLTRRGPWTRGAVYMEPAFYNMPAFVAFTESIEDRIRCGIYSSRPPAFWLDPEARPGPEQITERPTEELQLHLLTSRSTVLPAWPILGRLFGKHWRCGAGVYAVAVRHVDEHSAAATHVLMRDLATQLQARTLHQTLTAKQRRFLTPAWGAAVAALDPDIDPVAIGEQTALNDAAGERQDFARRIANALRDTHDRER